MNKITKLIKTLFLVLKRPSLVNYILDADEVWATKLKKKYPNKTSLPVIEIDSIIPGFNQKLANFTFLGGGSLPTDIMLLKALANQIGNCMYFEIGTWRGESVVNVAETAKKCYTLNLSTEEMLALNMPKEYADLHGFFSKGISNIIHLQGNSLHFDYAGLDKKFDLIFIDGNHSYEYVKSDTKHVFEHLLHENTVVVWHDYAYHPEKMRPEVLAGILDGIPSKFHQNLYHVSNTLCAIYTKTKLVTHDFKNLVTPNKTFEVHVKKVLI